MCSFRSVLVISATALVLGFFGLDFLKDYTRYEFLVRGDVCIAFDRQAEALKIVDENGCVTVPMRRTAEDALRDRTEQMVTQRVQAELQRLNRDNTSRRSRASTNDETSDDEDEDEESEED